VLIIGRLFGALKLCGSRASEVSLFLHYKHHRTLNWKTHEGRWIYGPHSLFRSTVDRSFGSPGFGSFQEHHNKYPGVSHWWTREVGWINGPQLPNIQWLIFTTKIWALGFLDCPYSKYFWSAKSPEYYICCQVSFLDQRLRLNLAIWYSRLWRCEVLGLRRISHLHTPKLSNYESLNTSTSPPGHHHIMLLRCFRTSRMSSSHSIKKHFF